MILTRGVSALRRLPKPHISCQQLMGLNRTSVLLQFLLCWHSVKNSIALATSHSLMTRLNIYAYTTKKSNKGGLIIFSARENEFVTTISTGVYLK